ncbi:MAG: hypothetical protein V5B78_09965 [Desulfohalobiaceae bacterium]
MRTTVDLPDAILRRAKAIAAMEGKSLKRFLAEALERELRRRGEAESSPKRVTLPLVPSENPGSVHLDGERIADVLEREDTDELAGY